MQGTSSRRVVITGMGVVSPMGIGLDKFWANLSEGKSGVTKLDVLNGSALPGHIGADVKNFSAKEWMKTKQRKSIKAMCREIQMGVCSATMALDDASLGENQKAVAPERLGIDFGANLMLSPPEVLMDAAVACSDEGNVFHHEQWGTAGLGKMEPLWLLLFLPNMPACHIGIYADARGPSNSLTMAEASSGLAISEALRILERDSADVMICGTTGSTVHAVQSFHAVMWDKIADSINGDPGKACRPFDLNRQGQVVAEASSTLIMEDETHATNRGARTYGHVLGAGSCCIHNDFRKAFKNAMEMALNDAKLKPADVGHVNAHATGDPEADIIEAQAIHDVFGPLGATIPVTAFKSYWGNPGASCGTLEIIGSLLGLQHGVVMPTLNYETPDPKIGLNVVRGKPLPVTNKVFIKSNITRYGQASAVVMSGV